MFQHAVLFGEELRKRRLAVGLSLTQLSQQVHYSKGQLSKVERGIMAPSPELVRLCDAAFSANGELASLMRRESVIRLVAAGITDDNEGWLMQLSSVGQSWIRPMTRRKLLGAGALSPRPGESSRPAVSPAKTGAACPQAARRDTHSEGAARCGRVGARTKAAHSAVVRP